MLLKPVSLMVCSPPTPPLYLLLMFVVFSFSLLFTLLISSAFSLILAHFHTSLLPDLHAYLFVSFGHSCVHILACIDTVTV